MKMLTLYLWDAQGLYTGHRSADPLGPLPARSTPTAPPEMEGAQVARWTGQGWELLAERPAPPGAVVVVPGSVTMRQARQAMLSAGILAQVDALIAAMPGEEGESARIDWNHAREVKRDWPLIGALGPQIGLTEQQIDDLFIYAATVPQ